MVLCVSSQFCIQWDCLAAWNWLWQEYLHYGKVSSLREVAVNSCTPALKDVQHLWRGWSVLWKAEWEQAASTQGGSATCVYLVTESSQVPEPPVHFRVWLWCLSTRSLPKALFLLFRGSLRVWQIPLEKGLWASVPFSDLLLLRWSRHQFWFPGFKMPLNLADFCFSAADL